MQALGCDGAGVMLPDRGGGGPQVDLPAQQLVDVALVAQRVDGVDLLTLQVLADRGVLVGADAVGAGLLEAAQLEAAFGRGDQHAVVLGDRPDPLEQRFALGQARGGEQPVAGGFQGLAVDAIPGEVQGQAVVETGAHEHLAHQFGGQALDLGVAGEVAAVGGHVEGWEVLGQQIDAVTGGESGMGGTGAQQQGEQQEPAQNLRHGEFSAEIVKRPRWPVRLPTTS
ncbi:hypothetical protein D3C80_1437470 [compost metagenome]